LLYFYTIFLQRLNAFISAEFRSNHSPFILFASNRLCQYASIPLGSSVLISWIKSKFSGAIKSKNKTAQINELLLKILCHNICVVIQEVNELGIKSEFVLEQTREVGE